MIKIGIGYDIHRLVEGRPLVLGGVDISFSKGLLGHSDGDCLIHAIADALLGALGEGDIGILFPDTDPAFKGVKSTALLEEVIVRLSAHNMEVANVDAVVICQEPRLAADIGRMKDVLSPILRIPPASLGIKPRTNEGFGSVGRGEAIAVMATVLIRSKE